MKINIPKPELRVSTSAMKISRPQIDAFNSNKMYSLMPMHIPPTMNSNDYEYANFNSNTSYYVPTKSVSSSQSSKRNTLKMHKIPSTLHLTGETNFHNQLQSSQSLYSIDKQREWSNIPDQTLGIPLTNTPCSFSNKSSLSMFPSTLRNNNIINNNSASTTSTRQFFSSNSISTAYINNDYASQPILHQYPLISGKIPQITGKQYNSTENLNKYRNKYPLSIPPSKPSLSILNSSSNVNENIVTSSILTSANQTLSTSNQKKETGEKNKVKFSDTVTVAVVPVS